MTTVIKTKVPYTYQSLKDKALKSGDPELQYDYYLFGDDKRTVVSDEEAINITETDTRKIVVTSNETLPYISDGDEEGTSFVLFDFEADNEPQDISELDEYMSNSTPLNYSPLRPLLPGEYRYKDAIVGVQLSISPNEGRYGLVGSTLHVDVQDTVEKGTVHVTSSGPETVLLQKTFYKEAKVLGSLVESSTPAAIEITEISLEGFKIGLKSLANPSSYVDGTIDWLVDGY